MRNVIKGIIIGVISTSLLLGSVAAATNLQKIDVLLNNIIIKVNSIQAADKEESYKLANGNEVPFSIIYKDTTYLPLRKVAELVNKDVEYDALTQTASINDKTSSNFRPINVVSAVTYDKDGNPEIAITAHNFTNKDIVSFGMNFYCYNAKDIAVNVDGNNIFSGICEESLVANGDLTDQVFTLTGFKEATNFGIEITEVKFKDGTTWDRSVIK